MNDLRRHSEDYLSLRRAFGYKLVGEGRLLAGFVTFCEQTGVPRLSTEVAVAWTTAVPGSAACGWHVASPATSIRSTRVPRCPQRNCFQRASTGRFPTSMQKMTCSP